MERRHFELERGHLNIDADGLYLSPSGNWQEALAAPERTVRARSRRTVYGLFGLLLLLSRALLEVLNVRTEQANGLVLAFGLAGVGMLVAMHRFRHDLAPSYRIPFAKVRSLEATSGRLTVHFVNGDQREDKVVIEAPPAALELARAAFSASRSQLP